MKLIRGKRTRFIAMLLITVLVVTSLQPLSVRADIAISEQQNQAVFTGEGFEILFKVTSQWDGAFNADVTIKNTSDKVIDNWAIGFAMPYEITNIWNGIIDSHENDNYVIKNVGSNQDIAIGQSINFGFSANVEETLTLPNQFSLLCYEEVLSTNNFIIEFKVTSDWTSGFNGEISIKNISDKVIEDWKLEFDYDGQIDRFWTAEILSQRDNHYIIKNVGYNANIKPGEIISLGLTGKQGNIQCSPTDFVLTEIKNKSTKDIDVIELEDGFIDKEYLNKAIYPTLLVKGESIEHVKLSDDFDKDGLTLEQEYKYDTDPFSKDTDEDGLNDYDEIFIYNTSPIDSDTDEDEMSDGIEVNSGLNPLLGDSNGNGLLDSDEIVEQNLSLGFEDKELLSQLGTLPCVMIEGKGDFSKQLYATRLDSFDVIYSFPSLVGTAYDFIHDENLQFETSLLTFYISDEELRDNELKDLCIASFHEDNGEIELFDTTYNIETKTISASLNHYSPYFVINKQKYYSDLIPVW